MKQTTLIFLFLALLNFSAFSQVDYLDFKERYNLSCAIPDSALIVRNQNLVDSLQAVEIISGEKQYLYDYAWVYYMRYLKWKNLDDLEIAVSTFQTGWTKYQDLNALWNLGLYRKLGDCEKALDMTDLYIQEVPDSISVDFKQVYYRYKNCR